MTATVASVDTKHKGFSPIGAKPTSRNDEAGVPIAAALLRDKLGPTTYLVWKILARHADGGGWTRVTNRTIAPLAGTSKEGVRLAVKHLRKAGLVMPGFLRAEPAELFSTDPRAWRRHLVLVKGGAPIRKRYAHRRVFGSLGTEARDGSEWCFVPAGVAEKLVAKTVRGDGKAGGRPKGAKDAKPRARRGALTPALRRVRMLVALPGECSAPERSEGSMKKNAEAVENKNQEDPLRKNQGDPPKGRSKDLSSSSSRSLSSRENFKETARLAPSVLPSEGAGAPSGSPLPEPRTLGETLSTGGCAPPRGSPSDRMEGIPDTPIRTIPTVTLPRPPQILETLDDGERAALLANAYRGGVKARLGLDRKVGGFGNVSKAKVFPKLVEFAELLRRRGISPAAWVAWSLDEWRDLAKPTAYRAGHDHVGGKAPSVGWVFSRLRLTKLPDDWSPDWVGLGGSIVKIPSRDELLRRYTVARDAIHRLDLYGSENAAKARKVFDTHFPRGWNHAFEMAKLEADRERKRLASEAAAGLWVWGAR